jgi:hypothetical protein
VDIDIRRHVKEEMAKQRERFGSKRREDVVPPVAQNIDDKLVSYSICRTKHHPCYSTNFSLLSDFTAEFSKCTDFTRKRAL